MARDRVSAFLLLTFLLGSVVGHARQGAPAAAEPATPTTLLENAQTRVLRVEILANSTRSMHSHDDMVWHVLSAMDAPLVLNIQGEKDPVRLEPWKAHFFKGGTVHSITNPNPRPVQFLEFFAKR